VDPNARNYDFSSLEIVFSGGVFIGEEFSEAMLKLPNVKRVFLSYGSTECGVVANSFNLDERSGLEPVPNLPPLSVGRLCWNNSLKILDIDTGRSLEPNQQGEVAVKGPMVSTGYLNRHAETAAAFSDGWFKTGDFGWYDNDGFVFILDRIKDTFIYRSIRVSSDNPRQQSGEVKAFKQIIRVIDSKYKARRRNFP